MTELLDANIAFIQWIEGFRTPFLTNLFLFITDVGSTIGYVIVIPFIWWGFSWKLGSRILVALVLSVYVNSLFKELIALPRPFTYTDVENLRIPIDPYSFPSGHSQQAALFWGLLAFHVQRFWFSLIAVALIFAIGFSRIYLGVHFPIDVLAGWSVGAIIAWLFTKYSPILVSWSSKVTLSSQLLLSVGIASSLVFLHTSHNSTIAMGTLAGALGGLAYAFRKGLYPNDPSYSVRRSWILSGILSSPVLYFLIQIFPIPLIDSINNHLYMFVRYALTGLWLSIWVPQIAFITSKWHAHEK